MLAAITDLVEFTAFDIESSDPVREKWVLADVQVVLSRAFRSGAIWTTLLDLTTD
jgi:nonsense-mediated mRNA decay protein 3